MKTYPLKLTEIHHETIKKLTPDYIRFIIDLHLLNDEQINKIHNRFIKGE